MRSWSTQALVIWTLANVAVIAVSVALLIGATA